MSYQNMDHAGWVEAQIEHRRKRADKRQTDRGRGWGAAPAQLTPFHKRAFDILGMVFGGIYNAPIQWGGVEFNYGGGLIVPIRNRQLSTFDFHQLTTLVFLCHEARIRGGIEAHGPRMLLLTFYQRAASGSMGLRHPNLEEAVEAFRAYLPSDHRVRYREAQAATEEERDTYCPAERDAE